MIKKIIWLLFLGIVAIYTLPLFISKVSLYLGGSDSDTSDEDEVTILFPPELESDIEATNSARFKLSGYTQNADDVVIFINNIEKDTVSIKKKDGSFNTTLNLFQGENEIEAKATTDNGDSSERSEPLVIYYLTSAPELTISSPENDQEIKSSSSSIEISGATDAGNTVTVNDRVAITKSSGLFTHRISLQEGENNIVVVATDKAGNSTTETISVRYTKE